jgi:hypothetical protein
MRHDLRDHLIHGVARLHHQHHAARFLQRLDEFGNRVRAHDLRPFGFVGQEIVHLGDGSIEHCHAKTVVVHIQYQVLAHHGQPDQSDITELFLHTPILEASSWP